MRGEHQRRRGVHGRAPVHRILFIVVLATAMPAAASAQRHARDGAHEGAGSGPVASLDTLAIHGVVVDSASGEPLPATTVRILELARHDYTHDDGSFHLYRLPAGAYTLIFEHIGYRTEQVTVTVPGAGASTLTVPLRASALDLPGVMVTATMGARSRSEAHRLSQVLGGRDLERKLDVTIAETLSSEAGMASGSMGPGPARPVIRGLSGDRILVLEDGERIGDVSSTSPDHAVSVEASSAERIEVVRGPSAIFYGSNALGGVINVVRNEIPVALPDHPTATLLIQGQSVNRGGAASASYTNAVGPVGLRVEGSGRRTDDMRTPEGPLLNTSITTYSGSAGAAWIGEGRHAGGAVRLYRTRYGIPPDSVSGHADGVTVEMERDALRGEAVVENFAGLGQLTATAGLTRYDHREIEATGGIGTAFGQNTGTAEVVLRHGGVGPFTGGGLGLRGQWQDYASDNGRAIVRSAESSGAVYGVQELELDRLLLQVGARYDAHFVSPSGADFVRGVPVRDRTFHNLSGSLSALWRFARGWRLGTSLSRAFRAPSSDELFSQGPHLAAYTFEVGNPDLEAETGLGVDLFLRVDRPGISAEAGVFWNEISHYSYPTNTGDRRGELFVYRYVNTDARFIGAEVSGQWIVTGPVVLDGDLSWVQATNRALDEPLPLIPPVNGQLTIRYDRDRYFAEAGVRASASQERVPDRPELPGGSLYCDEAPTGQECSAVPGDYLSTEGYRILNAGIGYRWFPGHQIHSVTLRAENITDELYRNHLSRIKELSPEPGLGLTLTYRASF